MIGTRSRWLDLSRLRPSQVMSERLWASPSPSNLGLSGGNRVPEGWSYRSNDQVYPHSVALEEPSPRSSGRAVRIARPTAPWRWGSGTLSQSFSAEQWRGRRVSFRASVRTEALVQGSGAELFVRVWQKPGRTPGSADSRRAVLVTLTEGLVRSPDWGSHAVEADVPDHALHIDIGLVLAGNGAAWFADLMFEVA